MSVLQLVTKMMGTVEKARIWEHRENPHLAGELDIQKDQVGLNGVYLRECSGEIHHGRRPHIPRPGEG